jgi:virulence factor Mce-like protein
VKRFATALVLIVAVGAYAALTTGASDGAKGNEFKVELDNAFGLIEGGDLKIAGVIAGAITKLDLDRATRRAIVSFEITEDGFGSLRQDASCEVAPQSLVGEYYVNCTPGDDPRELEPGSTIAVERTSTTVSPDLVNNIMRLPIRQRLSILVNELGAAVAGNGDNLNEAIRRASPALRETNRVLAILAKQNQVLADLTRDADVVVGDLARNKEQVGRFVTSARRISQDAAERDRDIARGFERLPGFLQELRPTMAQLQATVDQQGPALRTFAESSGQLERLFRNLPPLAEASRPAFRSLGEASKVGSTAVRAAGPTVAELRRYTSGLPELGKNLRITLDHLDDRSFSAEEDPRSPGGKGYTGLEAILQYVFDQTMSTNVYDSEVHILKALPFEGKCAQYADIEAARELAADCSTALGPNQVGINFRDPSAPAGYDGKDRGPSSGPEADPIPPEDRLREARQQRALDDAAPGGAPNRDEDRGGDGDGGDGDRPGTSPVKPPPIPDLDGILPGTEDPQVPKVPGVPSAPGTPPAPKVDPDTLRETGPLRLAASERERDLERQAGAQQLLDFLLGP